MGEEFVRGNKIGTLQYVVIKPLMAIITFVCVLDNVCLFDLSFMHATSITITDFGVFGLFWRG